jgi:outer membrane translocation and assembly module TamA
MLDALDDETAALVYLAAVLAGGSESQVRAALAQAVGTVRAGVGRFHLSNRALLGLPLPSTATTTDASQLQWRSDTLDDVLTPRSGHFLDLRVRRYSQEVVTLTGRSRNAYAYEGIVPVTFGRYTANFSVRGGTASTDGRFELGGLFNLTGTRTGEVAGERGVLARGLFYRNVSDVAGLRMPVYAGFSLETGNAVGDGVALDPSDFRHAASVFVNLQTVVGPVFLGVGRTVGIGNGTRAADFTRQVFETNLATGCQYRQAPTKIHELTHIARPSIGLERCARIGCDPLTLNTQLGRCYAEIVVQ